MPGSDQNVENHAWEIASDPSAAEGKWMAAVTLLDGKNVVAKTNPRAPGWIALPWSLVFTGASATGALIIFSSLQFTLAARISEIVGLSTMSSSTGLVFGIFSVPCLVFSMLFTYKRLLSDGGNIWKIAHWSVILLYLVGISLVAIDGKPVTFSDGGLLAMWNLACFSLAALGAKLAQLTFKGLNQTIGARKVLVPMMRSFAIVPIIGTAILVSGLFHWPLGSTFHSTFVLVSTIMFASTYFVVKRLNAVRSGTACSIATILWAPSVLANAALLPALAGTQIWLAFSNTPLINWVDYAGGLCALLFSITAPMAGGILASKQLQFQAARALQHGHERLATGAEAHMNSNLEQCFDE